MDCEDAMELIYAGCDEPKSPGDENGLAEHLRECEKCRGELRKLNLLEEVLRGVPEPPVSRARLGETVDAVSREVRGRGRANAAYHRVGVWAAAAAAVVVAAGIVLLAGRRLAGPTAEVPPSRPEETAARETGSSVSREEELALDWAGREDAAPVKSLPGGDLLAERLVRADLALSEADGPGQKAVIFCAMSMDVLSGLRDSVDRNDIEGVRSLGQGYTKLVREGVLANVKLAGADENRERVTQVADTLKWNRQVLELLVARTKGHERTLLAEALSVSEECLGATVYRPGFF